MLVLYRRKSSPGWLKRVREKVFGEEEGPRLMRREPIMLRVLRDIPVPSWKLVLPDKLLQFRPLDGLRADLVTVAGGPPAAALHAHREWLLIRVLHLFMRGKRFLACCCERLRLQPIRRPAYSKHVSWSRPRCKSAWNLCNHAHHNGTAEVRALCLYRSAGLCCTGQVRLLHPGDHHNRLCHLSAVPGHLGVLALGTEVILSEQTP